MTEAEVGTLHTQVLAAAFVLAALLGAVLQRTHFCIMGAVADAVNMADWTRARMWATAVGLAVVGVAVLQQLGWVDPRHTTYGSAQLLWLSHAVGGLLFGIGMVLASGCSAKTLVRVGGGSLKALVVLLVLGLSAFMTLKGLTAVARTQWLDPWVLQLPGSQTLPALLNLPSLPYWVGGGLLGWAAWGQRGAHSVSFWLAGLGTGTLVVAAWALTGHWAFVPEHPLTLEASHLTTAFNRPESYTFVAPSAGLLEWLIYFSDRSKALGFGVVSLLGVVAGSAVAALLAREFRWEGFRQTDDLAHHLVGALLMGVGGVTALGCTIGQGLSGLSTLSLGSLLTVTHIVLGGVLAVRYQTWRALRD